MHKITLPPHKLDELLKLHRDYFYDEKKYRVKLQEIIQGTSDCTVKSFLSELEKDLETILLGRPDELEQLVQKYDDWFTWRFRSLLESKDEKGKKNGKGREDKKDEKPELRKDLKDDLKKVFNYKEFSGEEPTAAWGAYQLCMELGLTVCPYCNRQYITTYASSARGRGGQKATRKTRAQLDHFYPQSKYPYLALSFFNLIPCCSICNSSLKGAKQFSTRTHIHPYVEGFDEDYNFTFQFEAKNKSKKESINFEANSENVQNPTKQESINYYASLVGHKSSWNQTPVRVKLKPNKAKYRTLRSKQERKEFCQKIRRAKRNVQAFLLEPLYASHHDQILELIQKSVVYNDDAIAEIYEMYPQLFQSEDDVRRMVLSTYVGMDEQAKRPFAKMIQDISKEFGL